MCVSVSHHVYINFELLYISIEDYINANKRSLSVLKN